MSAEVWVKFNSLDYTNSSGSLISFYRKGNPDSSSPNSGYWFSYDNRGNRNTFNYTCFGNSLGGFAGGGNNFGNVQYYHTFQTGSWNHIAFSINNSTGSFYINGIKKGADKIFSNLNLFNTQTSLAGETIFDVTPSRPSPHEIGTLRIYNRGLSQTEITQNYNALKSRFNIG
jgi:hypothetical protein